MKTSCRRLLSIVVAPALILAIPYACLAQDRHNVSNRARTTGAIRADQDPETIEKQLRMVDLDLKILDQNRQRRILSRKQQELTRAQGGKLAELDQQIADLRAKRERLQYEKSVQQLEHQMKILELDHQIREYNLKRNALQKTHRQEMAKNEALMRELDERLSAQSYDRQEIQLKQRRERLRKQLEALKNGKAEPKESE